MYSSLGLRAMILRLTQYRVCIAFLRSISKFSVSKNQENFFDIAREAVEGYADSKEEIKLSIFSGDKLITVTAIYILHHCPRKTRRF